MNNILVVGSINMDLIAKTDHLPEIGETVMGSKLLKIPGGKGANQAVSAAKIGSQTWICGKIAGDDYGKELKESLQKNNVKLDYLIESENDQTGTAIINVDDKGNNTIIVIPGANAELKDSDLEIIEDKLDEIDIILVQLEVPLKTVFSSIKLAKKYGVIVVLDPAPAAKIPDHIFPLIDIITPNLKEAERLLDMSISKNNYKEAAEKLLNKGVKSVVLTLGEDGVYLKSETEDIYISAKKVKSIDSTAAGDCFTGVFAAVYDGDNLIEAVDYANTAAAISTTKLGAQSSLPDRKQVDNFLRMND